MKTKFYLLAIALYFVTNLSFAQCELYSFNGNQSSTDIDLSWQSTSELDLDFYTIERSTDSINYTLIQYIDAVGNSITPSNYSFTDVYSFTDICYYYRLKATQLDGNSEYKDTVKVCYNAASVSVDDLSDDFFYSFYPNPARDQLIIESNNNLTYSFELINLIGEIVYTSTNSTGNRTVVDLNAETIARGTYFLRINTNNGTKVYKFIVER